MMKAEEMFAVENGPIYLGVGSFGSDDQMGGLGGCYRLKVDGLDRDLIVQAINTGPDVTGNQFDLQIGDGGFGANNKCAGGSGGGSSMFPGDVSAWGAMYGGVSDRSQCAALPKYPQNSTPMEVAGDDLVSLCEYSFDRMVRNPTVSGTVSSNPTIRDLARVKCPDALVEATQLQRNDEPDSFIGSSLAGFPNTDVICQTDSWDLKYCLTRMMDCCKPSAAWRNNVKAELTVPGRRVVQTCTSDGYTRIDVQCGCFDCNC